MIWPLACKQFSTTDVRYQILRALVLTRNVISNSYEFWVVFSYSLPALLYSYCSFPDISIRVRSLDEFRNFDFMVLFRRKYDWKWICWYYFSPLPLGAGKWFDLNSSRGEHSLWCSGCQVLAFESLIIQLVNLWLVLGYLFFRKVIICIVLFCIYDSSTTA